MSQPTWRTIALLTIGAVLIMGCGFSADMDGSLALQPSGTVITEELSLADFDGVDAADAFDVILVSGDEFEVMLRFDESVQEYLDVRVDGDTLYLELKERIGGYSLLKDIELEATVTMPELRLLTLSGASSATLSGFSSDSELDVQLSGASDLAGDISAAAMNIEIFGASDVDISGETEELTLRVDGASGASLRDLIVSGDADIEASGSSNTEVFVNGVLNVNASGASDVLYQGDPTLGNVKTSGTSSIESGN